MHAGTSTPVGTREHTRESLAFSRPADAVADLTDRVCHRHGGAKALSGGLIPESYPQIRRWTGDGSIPSLAQILRLVELAGPDDPFRPALIAHLEHLFDPTPVDPEKVAAEVAERLRGKRVGAQAAAELVRSVIKARQQRLPFGGER